MFGPHKTPDQSKPKKRQNKIAKTHVPDHGVAANLHGDPGSENTQGKQPMKETGGKIPDTNTALTNDRRILHKAEVCA